MKNDQSRDESPSEVGRPISPYDTSVCINAVLQARRHLSKVTGYTPQACRGQILDKGHYNITVSHLLQDGRRTEVETDLLLASRAHVGQFPANNYGQFDLVDEARGGHRLRVWKAVSETFLHLFFPLTMPVVYLLQGRLGLEMHSWVLCSMQVHETVDDFSRKYAAVGGPLRQFVAEVFLVGLPGFFILICAALWFAGCWPENSNVVQDLFYGVIFVFLLSVARGLKYGYRSPAAEKRLIDHASRRLEEFKFGWTFLPDELIIFLVRLCACEATLPLSSVVVLERGNSRILGIGKGECDSFGCTSRFMSVLPPTFSHAEALVPELVSQVSLDDRGHLKIPVAVLLLELVLQMRLETSGTMMWVLASLGSVLNGLLPVILRAVFLREHKPLTSLELALVVCSAWYVMLGSMLAFIFVNSATLVFSRRLHMLNELAGLLDGRNRTFLGWQMVDSAVQLELWDAMRRALLAFGKGFDVRAISNLACAFILIVACKLYVMYLFVMVSVTDAALRNMAEEPVERGLLSVLPILFGPPVCIALFHGAQLNELGKMRVTSALLQYQRDLIQKRTQLLESVDPEGLDLKFIHLEERQIECVQSGCDLILKTVETQMKPTVLMGHQGRGLFLLSYSLVLSYIMESLLNLALMSRLVKFS